MPNNSDTNFFRKYAPGLLLLTISIIGLILVHIFINHFHNQWMLVFFTFFFLLSLFCISISIFAESTIKVEGEYKAVKVVALGGIAIVLVVGIGSYFLTEKCVKYDKCEIASEDLTKISELITAFSKCFLNYEIQNKPVTSDDIKEFLKKWLRKSTCELVVEINPPDNQNSNEGDFPMDVLKWDSAKRQASLWNRVRQNTNREKSFYVYLGDLDDDDNFVLDVERLSPSVASIIFNYNSNKNLLKMSFIAPK